MFPSTHSGISVGKWGTGPEVPIPIQSFIFKKSVDMARNRNRHSARLHAGPGCCHSLAEIVAQKRAYPETTAV